MQLLAVKNDHGGGRSGQDSREGELIGVETRAPHLVEKGQGLERHVEMRQVGDKRCPSDNSLEMRMGD